MVHMIHDGGGAYVPPPPPPAERTQPVQHRATGSDTLQSLAEQYAVSPQAIRAANPQLGQSGNIVRGDMLEIPPPPQSVSGDIDLQLPPDLSAEVRGKSFSGDLEATGAIVERPRHGPGRSFVHRYGEGEGRVSIETFSGDARVRVE